MKYFYSIYKHGSELNGLIIRNTDIKLTAKNRAPGITKLITFKAISIMPGVEIKNYSAHESFLKTMKVAKSKGEIISYLFTL